MPTVAHIIRDRRRALGFTLARLAEAGGVTKSYLSMIENERVAAPPSDKILARLEAALEIVPGDLRRAAQWQTAPGPVKARLQHADERAQQGEDLAKWLKQATARRGTGEGKSLDHLYRTGQLSRRVNALLKDPGPATGNDVTPDPHRDLASDVPVRYRIPLVNHVAAGYPTGFTDLDYPVRIADEYVSCPDLNDPDAFAARVVGESMTPDYREGDIIVFSPAADITDGCDCFVRLEPSQETTFKRIYFDTNDAGDSMIRLEPLNPAFPPATWPRVQVTGLYRAVWRYAKL